MREYPLSHRDSTVLAIVMFICDTHALLKKDLRNVYVLFTYHSFSRPFMDLPLKTAGVGVLFFYSNGHLGLQCFELDNKTPAYSTVLLSRSRTLYCQDRQCQRPRMS